MKSRPAQPVVLSIPVCDCKRCGHRWRPRIESPGICPRCKSHLWNKARPSPLGATIKKVVRKP